MLVAIVCQRRQPHGLLDSNAIRGCGCMDTPVFPYSNGLAETVPAIVLVSALYPQHHSCDKISQALFPNFL